MLLTCSFFFCSCGARAYALRSYVAYQSQTSLLHASPFCSGFASLLSDTNEECFCRDSKATCEEQGAFELNDGDVRIFEENSTGARESEQSVKEC